MSMNFITDDLRREFLRKKGETRMTQTDLSCQMGISRITLSKIESGEVLCVQKRIYKAVLDFLNSEDK